MVGMVLGDLRVAVRGPYTSGLDDREVARLLGLPLMGEVPTEKGLLAAQDRGAPPGGDDCGPLARFCSAFWERAAVGGGV